MKELGTKQLIAKLWIWQRENLPDNELIIAAVERLEYLDGRVEVLEEAYDRLMNYPQDMP